MLKIIAVVTLSVFLATPVAAEEAYTYGDLETGEKVKVTKKSLPDSLGDRVDRASVDALYLMGLAAQLAGDGIMCDLMLTKAGLMIRSDWSLAEAASRAQNECLIQAARVSERIQK